MGRIPYVFPSDLSGTTYVLNTSGRAPSAHAHSTHAACARPAAQSPHHLLFNECIHVSNGELAFMSVFSSQSADKLWDECIRIIGIHQRRGRATCPGACASMLFQFKQGQF